MEMTLERLFKFDLVKEVEESLMQEKTPERLFAFVSAYQQIQSVDQFIKESPSYPGSTDKIVRSEMVSAIGATLAIEGTVLREEEIEESFRKADLSEKLRRKEREAENSRKVYEFIIDLVRDLNEDFAYSEPLIKQLHSYFTGGLNYLGNVPGQYRGDFPATFGYPRRTGLCKTRADIEKGMSLLISWLNEPGSGILSSNTIIKGIMAHYYLTEIHPFGDGNGRVARALEALVLYVNGVNSYCFWSLANFWSMHRGEYISHLANIRDTCDPRDFLIWGMEGYLNEITRIKELVLKKVKQLMLLDYSRYLVEIGYEAGRQSQRRAKISRRVFDVIQLLVRFGKMPLEKFLSSPEIKAMYKAVSPATKSRDFKKMTEAGLVRIAHGPQGNFIEPNYQILEQLTYRV